MSSKKKTPAPEPAILLGRLKGNLKMGLVGLPNVGKSTTFNFLSRQAVPAENYPFCTVDPNEAVMKVPDQRYKKLCDYYKPKSEVPPSIAIYDIAGLVRGAHQGEGLGNAFLSHIQSVDGIYHVLRAFEDPEISHVDGDLDPVRDLQTIHTELVLKDQERIKKVLDSQQKTSSQALDLATKNKLAALNKIHDHLMSGKWLSIGVWKANEVQLINENSFLTAKPVVYLVNVSIEEFLDKKTNKWIPPIREWIDANHKGIMIKYSAKFERICYMPQTKAEKKIQAQAQTRSVLDEIISTGYRCLDLIHYFTCGPDEVKCWTIRNGTTAQKAAGLIHSDFEKGFICAEVCKYADFEAFGSEAAVKAQGKLYQKGKDYIVEDGDILFFKFNVSHGGKK